MNLIGLYVPESEDQTTVKRKIYDIKLSVVKQIINSEKVATRHDCVATSDNIVHWRL